MKKLSIIAQLRDIRENDQVLSVGGDGCGLVQAIHEIEHQLQHLLRVVNTKHSVYDDLDQLIDEVADLDVIAVIQSSEHREQIIQHLHNLEDSFPVTVTLSKPHHTDEPSNNKVELDSYGQSIVQGGAFVSSNAISAFNQLQDAKSQDEKDLDVLGKALAMECQKSAAMQSALESIIECDCEDPVSVAEDMLETLAVSNSKGERVDQGDDIGGFSCRDCTDLFFGNKPLPVATKDEPIHLELVDNMTQHFPEVLACMDAWKTTDSFVLSDNGEQVLVFPSKGFPRAVIGDYTEVDDTWARKVIEFYKESTCWEGK